jgi:hypothetical protein
MFSEDLHSFGVLELRTQLPRHRLIERTSTESEMFIMSQRTGEQLMTKLNVNGKPNDRDIPDDMPLLSTSRDMLIMTATEIGCDMGLSGARTIHIHGQPTPSCIALRVELIAVLREAVATAHQRVEIHRR